MAEYVAVIPITGNSEFVTITHNLSNTSAAVVCLTPWLADSWFTEFNVNDKAANTANVIFSVPCPDGGANLDVRVIG